MLIAYLFVSDEPFKEPGCVCHEVVGEIVVVFELVLLPLQLVEKTPLPETFREAPPPPENSTVSLELPVEVGLNRIVVSWLAPAPRV